MMKKHTGNYLELVPERTEHISWDCSDDGRVTLYIENKGFFNWVLQRLMKKPKISQVHLDEIGSFVWQLIDSKRDMIAIGVLTEEHFGDKIKPTYERLAEFFRSAEDCGFVKLK